MEDEARWRDMTVLCFKGLSPNDRLLLLELGELLRRTEGRYTGFLRTEIGLLGDAANAADLAGAEVVSLERRRLVRGTT